MIENYEEYITPTMDEDDEMLLVKEALMTLTPVQRKIFFTYVEGGTYTEAAKKFGVSIPCIKSYIGRIRHIIIKYVFERI